MYLYLVERTDDLDYDEYDSVVVVANDEADARQIKQDWLPCDSWHPKSVNPETLKIIYLGVAYSGLKRGIIHESFQAG
jgi:hypothetical protein